MSSVTDFILETLIPDQFPEVAYKYRPVDLETDPKEFTLKLLTHGSLFFAAPSQFNDPFDLNLDFSYHANSFERQRWAGQFARKFYPGLSHKERREHVKRTLRKIRGNEIQAGGRKEYAEHVSRITREHNQNKGFGVYCCSGIRDNLLMWAHYARNHTGICVGFKREVLRQIATRHFDSSGRIQGYKVNYRDDIPYHSFFKNRTDEETEQAYTDFIATKSKHWEYENEYRLVYWHHADEAIECGPELIAEVVVGCRIDEGDEERVLEALESVNSNAKVFRARPHDRKFQLVIEPVTL